MRGKLYLVVLMVVAPTQTWAASGGDPMRLSLVGIADWASASISNNAANIPSLSPSANFGAPGVGLLAEGPIIHNLGLEVGVLYVKKKLGTQISNIPSTPTVNEVQSFHQLQIPVLLRYSFMDMLSVGFGGYVGSGTGSVTTSIAGAPDQTGSFTDNGYATIDYGLVGALGARVPIMQNWNAIGDLRYTLGLHELNLNQAATGIGVKSRDVQVLLGVQMTFQGM